MEVTYKVLNLLTVEFLQAANPEIAFYLSADADVTPTDVKLGSQQSFTWGQFLPPERLGIEQLTLPGASDPVWSKGLGTYTLGMIIDVAGSVVEGNETNNSNVGEGLDKESVLGVVGATLTVSSINDSPIDDNFSLSNLELREAITLANATQVDTIAFNNEFSAGALTIKLNGTQLPVITQSLTITGPGADKLAIDGDAKSRVFDVNDGSGTSLIDVSISGLTIQNGKRSGEATAIAESGAGIKNTENLTLDRVVIQNNSTTSVGGGLRHGGADAGTLRISNCSFLGNTGIQGGAIEIDGGTAQIINTTISGNSATGFGGGIMIFVGQATIRNCTITGNRSNSDDSGGEVGGVFFNTNASSVFNTIIAGNFSGSINSTSSDVAKSNEGGVTNSANNLIGDADTEGVLTHGQNGNIVGNNGSGTIPIESILRTTTELVGGTTPVHPLVPGSLALDRGSNSEALNAAGNQLGTDQRGRKRISDADADGTARVDIGAFESLPPVLANFGGGLTYTENGAPLTLSTNVTVSDDDDQPRDLSFLTSAVIRISLSQPHATDRLTIREAGDFAISGDEFFFESIFAGKFTGGVGQALVISVSETFSSSPVALEFLLRRIQFSASGENPPASVRNVRFQMTDAHGATSFVTKQLTVQPVNDKPVITLSGGLNFNENAGPLVLAGGAILADPDSFNFAGGSLTVTVGQNVSADDQLAIRNVGTGAGQIGVSGNKVTFGGTEIGTFSGGSGTTALVVNLNVACTKAAAQALVRNITFRVLGENPTALKRRVDFVINDGDGNGASDLRSKFVTVKPKNDGPTISGLASSTYTANGSFLLIAPNVIVTDPDTITFNFAKLTVSLTNATANDRLSVQTFGTGATQVKRSGEDVTFGGVKVAKLSGGIGTQPLLVTFNSAATLEAIQTVTRSIGFRILSGGTGAATRTLGLQFTDGGGGLGAKVTATITIQ